MSERPGHGAEPAELPADWPGPVSWGASLGAGGEVIADPTELVSLVENGGDGPPEKPTGPDARRRPAPQRTRSKPRGGDFRRRHASTGMPSLDTFVAAAGAAGLAGLAALLVLVVFFGGSIPALTPADEGADVPAAKDATTIDSTPRPAAPKASASPTGKARVERRAAARRADRDAATRRTQERRAESARAESARAEGARAEVAAAATPEPTPVPAPALPAPSVSPAEREFTPGPWNLS